LLADAALTSRNTAKNLVPLLADTLAPVLAEWIVDSRDAAVARGVEPIPASVREMLEGYVPDEILERVRWREGGSAFTLPQSAFMLDDAPAITLDYVIVFADREAALHDPKLWAHEIKHVMQFAQWGVGEFAVRYLRDYQAVEKEAWDFRWQWMKDKNLIPVPSDQ
jgi:hypothetical protein